MNWVTVSYSLHVTGIDLKKASACVDTGNKLLSGVNKEHRGHSVMHVGKCCTLSPGSQQQRWVFQPLLSGWHGWKPHTLPVFLLGLTHRGFLYKWIIHLLHLIWKAAVMRHFCSVFSHSGLSCAVSTVWLNSKLLMDCSKLAWGQKARDTHNIHILRGMQIGWFIYAD